MPVYRLSAQIIGRGSGKSAVAAAAYRAAERLAEEGALIPAAPDSQEPVTGVRIVVTVCAPLDENLPQPA